MRRKQSEPQIKARIRAAAMRLFSARGIEDTSVRDIVRVAGTTQPMLYYYFGTKENLYLDIFNLISEDLLHGVSGILTGKHALRDKIASLMGFYHGYFSVHPAAAKFVLHSSLTERKTGELRTICDDTRGKYIALLEKALTDHSTTGELSKTRVDTIIHTLNAAFFYFLAVCARGDRIRKMSRLPREMADIVYAGLTAGNTDSARNIRQEARG